MKIALFLLLSLYLGMASAAEVRFASGEEQNVMLELFTSQGCSSCPPAERYLNSFKQHPGLWDDFVPLAFHVDYWDYLGWKDRFSHPDNSNRQRQYARYHRMRTVYTPGFFTNGREWRRGLFSSDPEKPGKRVGNLKVIVRGSDVEARFNPVGGEQNAYVLNLAILGMGMQTAIQAGERRGSHSRHDFVVLGHKQVSADQARWNTSLPVAEFARADNYALVAWLTTNRDPLPIQVTGGLLKR